MKTLLKTMLAGALVALALCVPAYAAADSHSCRTDRMSSETYIYCWGHYRDGTPWRTVTVCLDGSDTCTTRDE
jgi:hypothetical protein